MNRIQDKAILLDSKYFTLETLLNIETNVVYCFLNVDSKRVQVYGTKCIIQHLGRILDEIKTSGEYSVLRDDMKNTEIVILESNILETDLKLKVAYWVDWYQSRGYRLFKELSPIRYKLDRVVEFEGRKLMYYLYARNKRDSVLLGRFRKRREMEDFISDSYPDGKVFKFLYHSSISSRGSYIEEKEENTLEESDDSPRL